MEILDPKSAIQKEMEALNNVATAPEEPTGDPAIEEGDVERDLEEELGDDGDPLPREGREPDEKELDEE